ncbi:MAG: efflux transporter periplasmic adaptor subunit, partial [Pseudomonadota bacterium]
LSDDGQVGVRVVQADETVAFKPVTIVAQEAALVWVNGLNAGDRVITLGQNYVAAGQSVVAVPDENNDKTAALDR